MDLDELERLLDEGPALEKKRPQLLSNREQERMEEIEETRSIEAARQRDVVAGQQKELEAKVLKQQDDVRRDDLTVLVLNLSLKALEKDVWKLMSESCGKVRDIQIVRDQSRKSKGIAYVEFYDHDSITRAFAISGRAYILGQPVTIRAAQAEKNRAARAAKQQAQQILSTEGQLTVYCGGLTDGLECITASEIQNLFSPFGLITEVRLPTDPYLNQSLGFAFLTFANSTDARDAIQAMNGFELGQRPLKVGHLKEDNEAGAAAKAFKQNEADLMQQTRKMVYGANQPMRTNADLISVQTEEGETLGASKRSVMQKLARDGTSRPGQAQLWTETTLNNECS